MSATQQENYARYKKYSTDLKRYYRMPAIQTSLSVVLSIFIISFFIFVALRPTFVTITGLKQTIAESQTTLKKLQTKSASLQRISATWDTILPLQKFVDNSIPADGPRYQAFTKAVEILAVENNVNVASETLGDALTYSKIVDPYSGMNRTVVSLPVSLRVTGEYPQVSAFLTALTSIDRLMSFESISFTKDVKLASGETGLSFLVSGKIHYLANESQLTVVFPAKNEGGISKEETNVPEK